MVPAHPANSHPTFRPGQAVTVAGAAGTCHARVLHLETPATLPRISDAPEVERVRAIMTEWEIEEIALLEHLHDGRPVAFLALRDHRGQWRDLHHQALTITPED